MQIDPEKFWAKVAKGTEGECWPWMGYRQPEGPRRLAYGIYRYGKRVVTRAHRAAYELAVGPIPAGMIVCHTCDVPYCCNPAHLWLGSVADNNADRQSKGRTIHPFGSGYEGPRPHGEGHGSARLTEAQAREILGRTETGAALAVEFGVTEITISRLRRGVTWKHLSAKEQAS